MNSVQMNKASNEIDDLIKEKICFPEEELFPILDGIVNIDDYCNKDATKYKILWVLKEPHDEMGGWNYKADVYKKYLEYAKLPTWETIAYTSFGILNNRKYADMDNISDTIEGEKVAEAIKQIAFINIKKIPGKPFTLGWDIEDAYIRDKEIIIKQINSYEPNIIIIGGIYRCGSTLKMLLNDLEIDSKKLISPNKESSIEYIIYKNKIIISAYHPSYAYNNRGVLQEKYCNDIIEIVNQWENCK